MARFGFFDVDSSGHATPTIEESDFTMNSVRSTPCPPGRNQLPNGSSSPDGDSKAPKSVSRVPDSGPAYTGPGDHPTEAQEPEKSRLRGSMATLREKLASSTALINNLRTRNDVFQAENTAKEAKLKEAREERDRLRAVADTETESGEALRIFVLMALSLAVLLVVVYSYWCWYNGPEMQYVLRRRREVLGV